MSNCIFNWDEEDFQRLVKSKRNELAAQDIHYKSKSDVKTLTHNELALHCLRITRGVSETTRLLHELIKVFSGEKRRDNLGVPLINSSRMKSIWKAQQKQIVCIQDPPLNSTVQQDWLFKEGRD
ncbi:hypothetical protein DPMN_071886 [Dreissena polymorpha]|uniref:Uncharacterized protein n=1 Tax=Dreissena polymorpha TaxID=45954 RepID=A0A9D4BXF6_DREPO|nr:hypothetical protein DPMN_071886 [Dreissena polymorpha]